jgi:hypothetical protein
MLEKQLIYLVHLVYKKCAYVKHTTKQVVGTVFSKGIIPDTSQQPSRFKKKCSKFDDTSNINILRLYNSIYLPSLFNMHMPNI